MWSGHPDIDGSSGWAGSYLIVVFFSISIERRNRPYVCCVRTVAFVGAGFQENRWSSHLASKKEIGYVFFPFKLRKRLVHLGKMVSAILYAIPLFDRFSGIKLCKLFVFVLQATMLERFSWKGDLTFVLLDAYRVQLVRASWNNIERRFPSVSRRPNVSRVKRLLKAVVNNRQSSRLYDACNWFRVKVTCNLWKSEINER